MTTIPIALLSATVALWAAGQSINLMTLGGLTLAIGILVDESVIAVENIHAHLAQGKPVATAVLGASRAVVIPRLLAMLCVVSVFAPSFFMTGVARALFVPLALAVAFAMISSYFLASTLVPILETYLNRGAGYSSRHAGAAKLSWLAPIQRRFGHMSQIFIRFRWPIVALYLLSTGAVIYGVGGGLGADIFPRVDTSLMQMRLRAPSGTRVERTEQITQRVLAAVGDVVGPENVETSIAFVGVQPSSYPVNLIYLWTGGPHEAVMRVALNSDAGIATEAVEEELRRRLPEIAPGTEVSFEVPDLVGQVMSFGAPTPIEIAITGQALAESESYARLAVQELRQIPSLRDVQLGELLQYSAVEISIDRERAGQLGVTVADIGQALAPATSSSRFTQPVYWADPASGIAYQVQVEIPQSMMASLEAVEKIPVRSGRSAPVLLEDIARVNLGEEVGEYHRYNQQRMVTITANILGQDLRGATDAVRAALARLPEPPRGTAVDIRGQSAPMELMVESLELGLSLSIVAVFLLLAAYFQSVRVALVVILTIPSVLAGVSLALFWTGTTLNIQSFMGAIMAIGVSLADSILLCTFAEWYRRSGMESRTAAVEAVKSRLRPLLMVSVTMIAGMTPLALGDAQTAPLGIAVIGGLAASTVTVLLVIPSVFALVQRYASRASASLDPEDPESRYFQPAGESGHAPV